MNDKVHGLPTKNFFVSMITKDISLEDCILDLLDNCIDGARREKKLLKKSMDLENFDEYFSELTIKKDKFIIDDNCGGISLANAIDYAFHFGRRKDAPKEADYSIGLYGIGMKRAIFKIGKNSIVESTTKDDAFKVMIDIDKWLKQEENDWDFDLESTNNNEIGTTITITNLYKTISEEFEDKFFHNNLRKIIARDYSFILEKGFQIKINEKEIEPFAFKLREDKNFKPIHMEYKDEDGVLVEISAGLSGIPPDDNEPDTVRASETEYYGWFVACNDRIVLASDKTSATVWGDEGFPAWHVQYNGFIGIINFKSSDPSKLPWTTTKRSVDFTDPIYRRAVFKMKDITRKWIDYTNSRKGNLDKAKNMEQSAPLKSISQLKASKTIELPQFEAQPRIQYANVAYKVKKSDLDKVKSKLGDRWMPNYEAGYKTFNYYWENEVKE